MKILIRFYLRRKGKKKMAFNPIEINKDTSEQDIADAIEKVHKWCEENIRTIIDIYFKRSNSIYSYLTREYPILVDDEMPTYLRF